MAINKKSHRYEDNLTSSEAEEIRSITAENELLDDVTSGEGYSIRGDLTQDVLTEGSVLRHPELRNADNDSDLAGVAESKERGELIDDVVNEDDSANMDVQPEID